MNAKLNNETYTNKKQSSGFSLIEVALAILVVAIGMLSVFSLLGKGLEASMKAEAETRSAIFADNVFNAMRAEGQRQALEGHDANTNFYWDILWTGFTNGTTNISMCAQDVWGGATPMELSVGTHQVVFKNSSQRGSTVTDVENYSMRYHIEVSRGFWSFFVPGVGISKEYDPYVKVKLLVWDGEFSAMKYNNAFTYYAEFNNPGDLKW